ncbi:MAG: hypothetical protein ACXVCY_00235 [Pseudobdellovibrionaceae bacterium]
MKIKFLFSLFVLIGVGCSNSQKEQIQFLEQKDALYSQDGREYQVEFQALYRSSYTKIADIKSEYLDSAIKQVTPFLFGPLVQRSLGGIQKGEKIYLNIAGAYLNDGRVMIPYGYRGTWLLKKDLATSQGQFQLPLPYAVDDLRTPKWKNCTDSEPGHNTWSFFWYYWDPERYGCDHQITKQYQMISVKIGSETQQTRISFPEYGRLIHNENGVPTLAMTFAFGYVGEILIPDPFQDSDYGMIRFQAFYNNVKTQLLAIGFQERPIVQNDITKGRGDTAIGAQFTGIKDGVQVRVSVVAAGGVDQMDLFAHSFSKQHEGFFGWFGHSRVGSGFDADRFAYKLRSNPSDFSLTTDYQLIYWAGCNSYSYYTLPFFDLKGKLDPSGDPNGTRNLDMISNGLPSLFSFNDYNASVLLQALLNWKRPESYQSIVNKIEGNAKSSGYEVMVNVLGDEDNPLPGT